MELVCGASRSQQRGHGCANPEIALLQVRQEFEAQQLDGKQRQRKQQARRSKRQNPMWDRKLDYRAVNATQDADDERLGLAHLS
jgi:hypothetical protein